MNTTAQGVDARGYLTGFLQMVTGMTIADIQAVPDDKWGECFGGCARPANALVADAVTNLLWTTAALKGEESSAYNNMEVLATELTDKSAAITALKDASTTFGAALAAASDETLNSTVMAPWQMPAPVFMLAQIAVSHIWYHDGQLNYIQAMCGDGAVHWMGD